MARLQISGHYAYAAVRSDVTPAPHFCPQPARCIECHADSLSCPLTQLYLPGVPGRVQRGSRGSRGFATSRKHENETNVPKLYVKPITQHPVLCAGGSSRTTGSRYPPSVHAAAFQGGFNRLHQLLHGFFTKSQVKSSQNHLPS